MTKGIIGGHIGHEGWGGAGPPKSEGFGGY